MLPKDDVRAEALALPAWVFSWLGQYFFEGYGHNAERNKSYKYKISIIFIHIHFEHLVASNSAMAWSMSICANASCRIFPIGSLHAISTRAAMVCTLPKSAKQGMVTSRIGANLSKASWRKATCCLLPLLAGASVSNLARIKAQQCLTCLLLGATPLESPRRHKVKRSSARQCLECTARSANSSVASMEPQGARLPPASIPSKRTWAHRTSAASRFGKDFALAWNKNLCFSKWKHSDSQAKVWDEH